MPSISRQELCDYLSQVLGEKVTILNFGTLGKNTGKLEGGDIKGYSYGSPLLIEYRIGKQKHKAVLSTQKPTPFGHDFFYDRAQGMLFSHHAFNHLPRHARSLDVGAMTRDGKLIALGKAVEFFLVDKFVEGREYFHDLLRLQDSSQAGALDKKRVLALSDYLVKIHKKKLDAPNLYIRQIRDLVGHGECIMGLTDNYPEKYEFIDEDLLKKIEKSCIDWRWKIKKYHHRLSATHGDFHPWNIMFKSGADFWVLDRSRGEYGEPADDISAMVINYLFFSLQKHLEFKEPFVSLYKLFMENYLEKTGDQEIAEVIQPFFAWRGLVVASPVWYPDLNPGVRKKIFNFIQNLLSTDRMDLLKPEQYMEG